MAGRGKKARAASVLFFLLRSFLADRLVVARGVRADKKPGDFMEAGNRRESDFEDDGKDQRAFGRLAIQIAA